MSSCKLTPTPMVSQRVLLPSYDPFFPNPRLYRSILGALQYITITRPDLAYAVNWACQFMHEPRESHYKAVKRILWYLKGTTHFSLNYSLEPLILHAYSDADWAEDQLDMKSTTGYCVFLGLNPILWSAKKQGTVFRTSTELDYHALASTATEICWLSMLLAELKILNTLLPIIWCDNKSAITLSANSVFHACTKHIELDYHFVGEKVLQKLLKVQYIPTEHQHANVLTKPLLYTKFHYFRTKLRVCLSLNLRGDVKEPRVITLD